MSNALDRSECFLKVICNICHDASRNLGLILRFSQSLSTLPQNTITFPPEKIFYQLKAHFCLTLLSQFLLICDKGSRINYVFNLASDSIEIQVPFLLVGLSVTSWIDLDGNYKMKPKKVVKQADNK